MFYHLSETLVINVKLITMMRMADNGWEVYFEREDKMPLKITEEQYGEIMEMVECYKDRMTRSEREKTVRVSLA